MSSGPSGDDDDRFTKTGKRKKISVKKYLSTREMVTGVRKTTNLPIQQPSAQMPGDVRIYRPSKYDILCGRGKPIQDHTGNLRMRDIVSKYTNFYLNSRFHKKQEIVEEVVKLVKNSGGVVARFLKRVGRENYWVEVSDAIACDKVSHALRCMVRKGGNSGPQEELDFGRNSAASSTTNEEPEATQDVRRIDQTCRNNEMKGDESIDPLLGVRGRSPRTGGTISENIASASTVMLPSRKNTGGGGDLALPNNLRFAGGIHSLLSHRANQPLVGRSLLSSVPSPPGVPPGVARLGALRSSPNTTELPATASTSLLAGSLQVPSAATLVAHNERLVDMLAREQIQREMAQLRHPRLVPPSEVAAGASQPHLAVINQELARIQALEAIILQRRQSQEPPPSKDHPNV